MLLSAKRRGMSYPRFRAVCFAVREASRCFCVPTNLMSVVSFQKHSVKAIQGMLISIDARC